MCTVDTGGVWQHAGQVFAGPLRLSGIEKELYKCPNTRGTANTAGQNQHETLKATAYVMKTWTRLQGLEHNVVTVTSFDRDI